MTNHSKRPQKAQQENQDRPQGWKQAQKAAHELIRSFQRRLPCEGLPLVASACGCASPGQILRGLNGESECPFEGIVDCPLSHTPTL